MWFSLFNKISEKDVSLIASKVAEVLLKDLSFVVNPQEPKRERKKPKEKVRSIKGFPLLGLEKVKDQPFNKSTKKALTFNNIEYMFQVGRITKGALAKKTHVGKNTISELETYFRNKGLDWR